LHEERGQHFGAGLYESEVRYLMSREWAHSMEDILWRRSKLGLRLSQPEQQQLHAWLEQHQHALPKAS
jgi:glycerol-3-phosphate dehydrogenase